MGYTRIFNYIFFILFFILSGCNLFKSSKVSSSEIKSASSWSSNDENPSYSECEDLNTKENFDCFGSIVSESIIKYISEEVFDVNVEINEDIKLVINIDKEGKEVRVEIKTACSYVISPDLLKFPSRDEDQT